MDKIQPKLKAATEQFCNENPDLYFCKEDKTWYKYSGQFFEVATAEFEDRTSQIWEDHELLYNVHLKNLRNLCAVKKAIDGPLNCDSEFLLNTPGGVINIQKFNELYKAGKNHKEHIYEWIRPHCVFRFI